MHIYVCMYMYVCICMYVYMTFSLSKDRCVIGPRICILQLFIKSYGDIYVYKYAYINVCMYVCMYACMFVFI